ncbi:hypothetical protein ACJX0J_020327, partial [Zea mays]
WSKINLCTCLMRTSSILHLYICFESKETTARFVNVTGMAKLQPDASLTLSFLLPLDTAIEGLHDMILLNACDDLDVLSLCGSTNTISTWRFIGMSDGPLILAYLRKVSVSKARAIIVLTSDENADQ